MSSYQLVIRENPDEDEVACLHHSLVEYNLAHSTLNESQEFAIFLHSEEKLIMGGIMGVLWGEVIEVDYLWVHPELRGQGYGKKLLLTLEQEAFRRGSRRAILNTYDFQAPDFYLKLGYEIFGIIGGLPNEGSKYFLKKELKLPIP